MARKPKSTTTQTKARKTTTKAKAKIVVKAKEPLVKLPTTRQLRNTEAKRRFIEAFGHYGTITKSCAEAGISPTTYYLWTNPEIAIHYGLDVDKHYDAEFHRAAIEAWNGRFTDRVLHTGYTRGLDGWTDYHYDRNGNLIREEEKYDSAILQMLMKRVDPKFKDKTGDVNFNQQNNVNVYEQSAAVLDKLTPQQKKLLLQAATLATPADDVDKDNDTSSKVLEGKVLKKEIRDAAS